MDANSGESVRPLTDRERATLDGFLSSDFAGVEELRAQVSTLQARPSCSCGCGSIALLADRRVAASPRITWSPLEADVVDDAGNSIGGLLLFANDGYLDDLEVYSYLDEPLQLPPVDRIRWSHVDS
ncbi:hypothetical protein [Tsukamurella tyrosinosolvens]|uniref:hypothetical protein n=1 Tax=Tsukamurella tyrosinosolvens TaxID=57704 RepID=UPI0011C02B88|nr:hypothetical protein [Tsukamurella tyrosinosolvens]MEC4615050.1 hypothetical protein [Tsukamurella tyrosinosolvens]